MQLFERKQIVRDTLSDLENNVSVSLKKLKPFHPDGQIWAWYSPLKDEPFFKDLPPGIKFCSPQTFQEEMKFVLDDSVSCFEKSSLGVQEPQGGKEVKKDEISVMLIPGLAFDNKGHRLGRGKGYYDRFLTGYTGLKVGVCSKNRFVNFPLPVDPKIDVSVDLVLTEDFVYQPMRVEEVV